MLKINPVRAWIPKPEFASQIAALPYDTFPLRAAREEIVARPHSFLRLDKPWVLAPPHTGEYDTSVYELGKATWNTEKASQRWIDASSQPAYYIYRTTIVNTANMANEANDANMATMATGASLSTLPDNATVHIQTGIIAEVQVADYISGDIRRHENTREAKLDDRVKHIKALEAQASPVFLAYRQNDELRNVVLNITDYDGQTPLYDFYDEKGGRHQVWQVCDPHNIAAIAKAYQTVQRLYIADGHHRAAAAAQVANEWGETRPLSKQSLAILYDAEQLNVMDYNRVVHDLAGLSTAEYLSLFENNFTVTELPKLPLTYPNRNNFQMYLAGKWYNIALKKDALLKTKPDALSRLDVSLLQNFLLGPILKIDNPSTNTRIHYMGGIRGLTGLQHDVDHAKTKGEVAFALRPVEIDELFAIADKNELMPPKSTWFEPKPLSGLVVRPL